MMETHEEFDNIWQDDDMLEYTAETKYLSSPMNTPNSSNKERTLAKFQEGVWKVENQVQVDGEWYVASRDSLNNPPEGSDEWRWNGRVESNYGAFTGLSKIQRVVLAPIYAVWFAWLCVSGHDVNLQTLDRHRDN